MKKILTIIVVVFLLMSSVIYKQAFFLSSQKNVFSSFVPYQYNQVFFSDKNFLIDKVFSEKFWLYQESCLDEDKMCLSLPHQAWLANILWLRGVQLVSDEGYVDYHSGLFLYLDSISALQPYWKYPYVFGQILLPKSKAFEETSYFGSGFDISWDLTINYGEKGIKFLCEDTCVDYVLARSLAFNYFYYLGNSEKSSEYYLLASKSPDAPAIFAQMPAIVVGRLGEHLGSSVIWYEQFLSSVMEEGFVFGDGSRYLQKAVYEYSLYLLQEADNLGVDCKHDINCLKSHGVISDVIFRELGNCEDIKLLGEIGNIQCTLLGYGLENGYISFDGSLVYPLESGFEYVWRADVGSWWIGDSLRVKS